MPYSKYSPDKKRLAAARAKKKQTEGIYTTQPVKPKMTTKKKINKPLSGPTGVTGPKDWFNMTGPDKPIFPQLRAKKLKSKKNFNMPVVKPNYHWEKKPKGSISA